MTGGSKNDARSGGQLDVGYEACRVSKVNFSNLLHWPVSRNFTRVIFITSESRKKITQGRRHVSNSQLQHHPLT